MTIHEKIQLARSRHQLARLLKLSQEQEKALEENPRPFLDKAYAEVARHRQMLDDIRRIATGVDQMSVVPPPGPPPCMSISEEMFDRIVRIQTILEG